MVYLIQISFSFLATVAFGILTNVPRKALLACGLTGMTGWMTYWLSNQLGVGLGFSNFFGAFVIGLLSVFFSRKMKMPMIIFNIPSLVPLVPGGPAYKAVRDILLRNFEVGVTNLLIVLVTAGAIAAGFMATGICERMLMAYLTARKNKKIAKGLAK